MNLCSSGHDEICHEGNGCPVCSIISDKDGRIDDLESEVAKLKSEIEEIQSEQQ